MPEIEQTEEMVDAVDDVWVDGKSAEEAVAAVLAIVQRDYTVSRRPAAEQLANLPAPPRRLRACVENWPEAQEGEYNPRCCRWPKSCSATVYDEDQVTDADLEPVDTAT